MKCPKCRYIGFETGDRCRNCGYEFSLLSDAEQAFEPALEPAATFLEKPTQFPEL